MDDSTIQSDNTSNSTGYDPSDSDEASGDSTSDDGRSLSGWFHGGASPPMECSAPPEEPEVVEELKVETSLSPKASKKDKKKSKVAAQRAVFEFD